MGAMLGTFEKIMESNKLVVLQALVNKICVSVPTYSDWSVNWATLRCVDAEFYINVSGEVGLRVYVEEADPAEKRLKEYIENRLQEMGRMEYGIEVVLNW